MHPVSQLVCVLYFNSIIYKEIFKMLGNSIMAGAKCARHIKFYLMCAVECVCASAVRCFACVTYQTCHFTCKQKICILFGSVCVCVCGVNALYILFREAEEEEEETEKNAYLAKIIANIYE